MRGGINKTGYTITEVMIVLVISSGMFVLASTFIYGRASQTSFRSGVNETASKIQDTIDQVANGQFSDLPIKCQKDPSDSTKIKIDTGTNSQGTNTDCSYAGKTIAFDMLDYNKYTVSTYAYPAQDETGSSNYDSNKLVGVTQFDAKYKLPGGLKLYIPPGSVGYTEKLAFFKILIQTPQAVQITARCYN
jgi:Tfp pilus assembly protein FimT